MNRHHRSVRQLRRALALLASLGLLALFLPGMEPGPATAHNLQTKMV